MYKVKDAKNILFGNVNQLPVVKRNVTDCLGYTLSENIYSPVDIPLFNNSAVDGFAVNYRNINLNEEFISFLITGEIKAGDNAFTFNKLKNNSAVYIYTGAAIPVNTSYVVMQEFVNIKNGYVIISADSLKKAGNIRLKASQIKKGKLALSKGHIINAASIGFLCSMGIIKIKVIYKPVVSVISTGNELQKPGEKLLPGHIFESNSFMLEAALKQSGYRTVEVKSVEDISKIIFNNIKIMLAASDVVIITGGISVGKYDLVKEILLRLGVTELFYKVSQKPGKPLYAGKYKNKFVFALPGNPAASLVCFYEYVLPALNKMSGHKEFGLKKELLPLTDSYEVKGDRDLFLKAKLLNGKVTILEGQESFILKSFTEANAIVYFTSGNRIIKKGSLVETHILPVI